MKLFYVILLSMLVMGCYPGQEARRQDESTLIRIECRNDIQLRQMVQQYLRLAKARDITVEEHESALIIKAAYLFRDTPLSKVVDIAEQIRRTPGVLDVNLEYNRGVVRDVS